MLNKKNSKKDASKAKSDEFVNERSQPAKEIGKSLKIRNCSKGEKKSID